MDLVREDPRHFMRACLSIRNYAPLVRYVVRQDGLLLYKATHFLRADYSIVSEAVGQNGMAIRFASFALRGNLELARKAVSQTGCARDFLSPELRRLPEIISIALKTDGSAYEQASPQERSDADILFSVVKTHPGQWKNAAASLTSDRNIVAQALTLQGMVYAHLSSDLQRDPAMIALALSQNGHVLDYIPDEFRTVQLELLAVRTTPSAIMSCWSREVKDNRAVVEEALRSDPHSIAYKYASKRLKSLPWLAAVAYASPRANRDTVDRSFKCGVLQTYLKEWTEVTLPGFHTFLLGFSSGPRPKKRKTEGAQHMQLLLHMNGWLVFGVKKHIASYLGQTYWVYMKKAKARLDLELGL